MSFRLYVRRVEVEARQLGIRLSMMKFRDAVARSFYDRHYSAVAAAENAGALPPLVFPPPYIHQICEIYRIDCDTLERACNLAFTRN